IFPTGFISVRARSHAMPRLRHRGGGWSIGQDVCRPIGLVFLLLSLFWPESARAQRPFPVNDPFYRSETARKVFHDGIAATGEVAYRASGPIPGSGLPTSGSPLRSEEHTSELQSR